MSKLLKQKTKSMIIPPFTSASEIKYGEKETVILTKTGQKLFSKCIGCKNHECCIFTEKELSTSSFSIPTDIRSNVCPSEAINFDRNGGVIIDKNRCIGCGLCILRCPLGAIHLVNGVADVANADTIMNNPSKAEELKKEQLCIDIKKVKKTGSLLSVNEKHIQNFYDKFEKLPSQIQIADILVRNLFIQLGAKYGIRRRGDVINRIDGIMLKKDSVVLNEVELSEDVLESPRAVLDDIAIYKYKFASKDSSASGLITLSHLPNTRAELWRVIEDIYYVLGIKIDVVTIGTLLVLAWNGAKLDNVKSYFYDQKSKCRAVLKELSISSSAISNGFLSVFETNK